MDAAQVELTRWICAIIYAFGVIFFRQLRSLGSKYRDCGEIFRKTFKATWEIAGKPNSCCWPARSVLRISLQIQLFLNRISIAREFLWLRSRISEIYFALLAHSLWHILFSQLGFVIFVHSK